MKKEVMCTMDVSDEKVTITFDCKNNQCMAEMMAKMLAMSGDNEQYTSVLVSHGAPAFSMPSDKTEGYSAVKIKENGDIFDIRQYHRFVTAHLLRMGRKEGVYWFDKEEFNKNLKELGVMYSWRETADRIHAISMAENNGDTDCVFEDSVFYNKHLLIFMLNDLKNQMHKFEESVIMKTYKGKKYIKFVMRLLYPEGKCNPKGTFYEDFVKIHDLIESYIEEIYACTDFKSLDKAFRKIVNAIPNLDKMNRQLKFKGNFQFKQSQAWKRAYKGFGAYFTMKNLVMGKYGLKYMDVKTQEMLSGKNAKIALRERLEDFTINAEQYKLMGELRYFFSYNNFNFHKVIEEWKIEKRIKMNK